MVNRLDSLNPNLSCIHGKKWVKLKCRPRTPLGIPVDPEVNESVPTESGPRGMLSDWEAEDKIGEKMSEPEGAEAEPSRVPDDVS